MSDNHGQDKSNDGLSFFLVFFIVISALLYLGKPYLITAWLHYAKVESYVTSLGATTAKAEKQASNLYSTWLDKQVGGSMSWDGASSIRHNVLSKGYHNYLIAFILLLYVILIFKKWNHPYKGLPSLESLIKTESAVWPSLEFIKRFNPFIHWNNELRGIGRFMLSGLSISVENGIIIIPKTGNTSKKDRVFNDDKAKSYYIKTLGPSFVSYSDLPVFYQVFTVILIAKELRGNYKEYDSLMRFFSIELSDTSNKKKTEKYITDLCRPIMSLLDNKVDDGDQHPLIKNMIIAIKKEHENVSTTIEGDIKKYGGNYSGVKSTLAIFRAYKHSFAFASTYVIGAGRYVRRHGKFPAGRLVFFKPWDRHLFLLLSNTPYYTDHNPHQFVVGFSAEVLGCFGHYQHEVFAQRRLDTPYVYTAVSGLKSRLAKQNIIEGTTDE